MQVVRQAAKVLGEPDGSLLKDATSRLMAAPGTPASRRLRLSAQSTVRRFAG